MYIVPMNGITPLETITKTQATEQTDQSDKSSQASFSDIFKQALQNVEDTQQACADDSVKASLGEVDDLHTVQINLQKAATALDVLVAMKNTAIDSYNEVMRMSI